MIMNLILKIEVFKESKEEQVAHHRYRQGELLISRSRSPNRQERNVVPAEAAGNPQAHRIINDGRTEHQQNEPGVRPPIKPVAEQGQAEMPEPLGRSVIDRQHERQEVEKKQMRAENHSWRIEFPFGARCGLFWTGNPFLVRAPRTRRNVY